MIKKLLLFGGLIGSSLASPLLEGDEGVILKTMTGKDDIMNMDTLFSDNNILNKLSKGKGKEKDRKKKPKKRDSSSSSSNEDERNSRRSRASRPPIIPVPAANNEQVMRQQELVTGGRNSRHTSKDDGGIEGEDNVITVTGPIRRKPLIRI